MPYRQRLVWKLSSRTMRLLRPTDRLTSYLPTIEEHNINNNLSAANLARLRFVLFFKFIFFLSLLESTIFINDFLLIFTELEVAAQKKEKIGQHHL